MLARKLRCRQLTHRLQTSRQHPVSFSRCAFALRATRAKNVPSQMRRRFTSDYKLTHEKQQPGHSQPSNGSSSHHAHGEPPMGFHGGGEHNNQYSNEFYFYRVLLYRLAVAYGSIYCISEYVFQLTNCNGPSMLPTLKPVAEIIFVDRLTPRLFGIDGGSTAKERVKEARIRQNDHHDIDVWHQPFIPANALPKEGKWKRFFSTLKSGISIGDVVVVEHPQREGTICKRVVGLPGDEIILKNTAYSKRRGLWKVPDGHLWLEGDNSENSLDSRTYGAVPAAMIVGRVPFRVWPLRGDAMIERGMRPKPKRGEPRWGASGSTSLPAGYQGETIMKGDIEQDTAKSKKKRRKSSA